MTLTIVILLTVLAAVLMFLEMRGVPITLKLSMKGDIKRESAFLAQYGQSVATPIAAWLMAIAKGQDQFRFQLRIFCIICLTVIGTSLTSTIIKRSLGRMRPNRENAGKFTGPAWRNDNQRESFPSSHSSCAFALSMTLIYYWPEAAVVFWLLAFITAILRYLMDAHFPSDVIAGSLLGVVMGYYGVIWLDLNLPTLPPS